MNLKFIVSCMFFITIYTQPLLSSQKNDGNEGDDFEVIETNQTADPIFNLIEQCNKQELFIWNLLGQNSITTLDKYLTKNPKAINARTPYRTDVRKCYSGGALTEITGGLLPFHIALTYKHIACLQVLLKYTGQYSVTNDAQYRNSIYTKLGLNEHNSYHRYRPFLYEALDLDNKHNDLFTQLTHISSQEEKDAALNEAIDNAHGQGRDYKKQLRCKSKIPVLLENNADINNQIWRGRTTMLHRAFMNCDLSRAVEIIDEYETYKPDMTRTDNCGKTPFDYYLENHTKLYEKTKFHGTTPEKVHNQIQTLYQQQMSAKQQK